MDFDRSPQVFSPAQGTPPISFQEARSIVSAQAAAVLFNSTFEQEQCGLSEALGRVLATAIVAERDQPPFPRVTRDGFAVRAHDLSSKVPLRVTGQIRAGERWSSVQLPLIAGEAIEIMTGAPLPPGANAVLMVEHTREVPGDRIPDTGSRSKAYRWILPAPGSTLTAGENVVVQGSEAKKGVVVLEAGTRLLPEEIALATSCGLRLISAYRQPKAAILTTGDELWEPASGSMSAATEPIEAHQIYDSNSRSLSALVQQAGAVPLPQRAARDKKDDLAAGIHEALKLAPLLLLTGGVSMGRYDLVEEVLAGMGAEFFFTGVKMQPGKPVVFGRVPTTDGLPQRFFFGLPGNPVSAMVTFRVFAQPLLAALSGERHWQPKTALANLTTDLQYKPGLTRFIPAHLETSHDFPTVTPVPNCGSGDLAANARANCYAIVPEDCDHLAAGQPVQILLR